ncbi:MAG: flavodoxin family protein, partial [Chloroflexota bacterium]
LTSQAKAVVDRCQALWVGTHRLGMLENDTRTRTGVFVSVGATEGKRLFDGAILTVKYFFDAIGVEYWGELLVRGVDTKGEIRQRPEVLEEAFVLGKKLVDAE